MAARRSQIVAAARSHGRAIDAYLARMAAVLEEVRWGHPPAATAPDDRRVRASARPEASRAALSELSRLLVARAGMDEVLQRVANLAVAAVPGCDAAGVSVLRNGRVETGAVSDPVVATIDAAQYRLDEGPCLDAIRRGAPCLLAELPDRRWPSLSRRLPDHGVSSVLSLPLDPGDGPIGAVNLYATRPLGVARSPQASPDGEAKLRAGATLLLYTDGLVERRGEDIDAGLQRLTAAAAAGPQDLDGWCDWLLARQLHSAEPEDDVAVLAARLS